MGSIEEKIKFINNILRNKDIYNYVTYLNKLSNEEQDEELDKYMNTLELFAFGDYLHYLCNQNHYILMDSAQLLKLIRLTILSAAAHEGKVIKIDELFTGYKLKDAIEHYSKVAKDSAPSKLIFEKICIDMIDDSVIEIKLNDIENTIITGQTNVIRDSYDANSLSLRILKKEDISDKDLSYALARLQDWFENSLKPAKTDLDAQIHSLDKTKDVNSRKRKPSDNC